MRLLLLSSSTIHARGYLDHAAEEIRDFFGPAKRVAFVPYAIKDHAEYTNRVRERLGQIGLDVVSVHEGDPRSTLTRADGVFVGGGNTFRLLSALYETGLIKAIPDCVRGGMPYLGASAGTVVAAPTIRTTNDMPIVEPSSFQAMALVPFQVNAHYLDPDPNSTFMGETREERLLQFLEENETPVVGLREPSALRVDDGTITLIGPASARIFRRGIAPEEVPPGTVLHL